MYLKRLEIQGFKSFADRVELEFPAGITALVGPNGSGKSNIVDSIRWVLGEQSAKSLRGSKMDDVIFAGSANRRAVGMAQVALTLDNSAGIFPIDYDEVTISRRLYRSGESEYLINKSPCRLRDIHELFMDTGLGREGFSVIGQGKVDEILSLKPEDRRGLIEEAAGIIKYKYRKREAEKKLNDTEENLIRIHDIVNELNDRIGPLEEQAKKAQQYHEWKEEIDKWEISLEVEGLEKSKAEQQRWQEESVQLKDKTAEIAARYHQLDSKLMVEKVDHQKDEEKLSLWQQEFYELNSQLEKKESEITLAKEMGNSLVAQISRLNGEIIFLESQLKVAEQERLAKVQESEALRASYGKKDSQILQLQEGISKKKAAYQQILEQIEEKKNWVIENMQDQARSNNELMRMENQIANNQKGLERIESRMQKLLDEQHGVKQSFEQCQKEQKEIGEQLATLKQSIAEKQAQLQQSNQQLQQQNQRYEQSQRIHQQNLSRLNALRELEDSGEGYQQGVKAVLEQKKKNRLQGIVGPIAELIKVPQQLEKAIETVMGAGIQNIITENDASAQKAIAYLKENKQGRATFLPLNTVKGTRSQEKISDPSVLGLAVDLLEFDPKYTQVMNYLLGRVWVVSELKEAVRLGKEKGFNQRIVTLEGDLITPGGALTGGNHSKQKTSLLTRKRQIEQLESDTKIQKEQLQKAKEEIEQLRGNLEEAKNELAEKQNTSQQLNSELGRLGHITGQLNKELQRIDTELQLEQIEKDEIRTEINQLDETISREKEKNGEIHAKQLAINDEVSALQENSKVLNQEIEEKSEALGKQKVELATFEQQQNGINSQLEELEKRKRQSAEQLISKTNEGKELIEQKENREKEAEEAKELVGKLAAQIKGKEDDIHQLKDAKQEKYSNIQTWEQELKLQQQQLDQAKNSQYQSEIELNKAQTKVEVGERKLNQQFGYTFEEALAHKVKIDSPKEIANKVQKLKGFVKNLGTINFTAVEEHEKVKERLDFLGGQFDDLVQAKEALEKVIKEMDQIMGKKFEETYYEVNKNFNQVFQAMFGGGSAKLELSDPHDFLQTGVEIVAQPPGKKAQVLSLLSGGERAMTAIALLFAILNVKPSPFCILDEIEAALDDVNVNRFATFLQDYTHKTQFIVISHRKGTMEAAGVLFGVTMEDNGVSRLMSVKLNEVDDQGRVKSNA